MAAVRSTRDWPIEGLRFFVEDRKRGEVLGGRAVLGVLHSTLKLPEHVELSRAFVGSRINESNGRPATYAPNSPRSLLRERECR
jgi:hypothetical protein